MEEIKLFSLLVVTMSIVKFATTQNVLVGTKWNKRTKNFESIPGLYTYEAERRKIALQSRQRETHDFKGAPLNLTYYEDLGFFEFHDNDTRVTGIVGDVWTILSNFLNFTLVLSNSKGGSLGVVNKNGSYNGILEYTRLDQTDVVPKMPVYVTRLDAVTFSTTLWMSSQRIFAHEQWEKNPDWMIDIFSVKVWLVILSFIVALSLGSLASQKISIRYTGRKLESSGYLDHLFNVLVSTYNQDSSCPHTGSGSRILNTTIAIFSFLILTTYNTLLIYRLSEESSAAPFHDLEGLLENTNFRIVVLDGSRSHITINSRFTLPIFRRIKRSKRVTVVSTVNEMYEKVCKYSNKYVMFDADDVVAARGENECSVIPIGVPYYLSPIAAGYAKRVIYKKTLDIGLIKLREYGLLDGIKKRYMLKTKGKRAVRQADAMAIDVERVSLIFGVLCLGIVVSIIVCAVENIIFLLKKRKTVQSIAKKVITIRTSKIANSVLRPRGRNR